MESTLSVNAPNVLMVGTGEYTTGYVDGAGADSDKGAGVVALVMFDLRQRGLVGRQLGMCGTNGAKFKGIRAHLQAKLSAYPRTFPDIERDLAFMSYPAAGVVDPKAYETALADFKPGDAAIIFTPDDTHFAIAKACLERGLHVLLTKPAVKTLADHLALQQLAASRGLLCCVEVHKRWDPVYVDARDRLRAGLGALSFFSAYMSQPKHQLHTFRAWAGRSSDISYYLNSHHVDYHAWCEAGRARPVRVVARGSNGLACRREGFPADCEDTITLLVDWQNAAAADAPAAGAQEAASESSGHGVYTASWAAPRSDVHSQQRFHWLGRRGELTVDQAHRGYSSAEDGPAGFGARNPHFMKYSPTDGRFGGQGGYGYRSFEAFVTAVAAVNGGSESAASFDDGRLATLATTATTTAVLEAGRRSLDAGGRAVQIVYASADVCSSPVGFELC